MCGSNREQALAYLTRLERQTTPARARWVDVVQG